MKDNISDLFDQDDNFNDTLKKIEVMLLNNKATYFDVDSFVEVIDYLLGHFQNDKARKIINIGLRQHPKSEDLLLKKAYLNIKNKHFDKAKHILNNLVKTTNGNPDIYYCLGYLYVTSKNTNKAKRYYDSALSMSDIDSKFDFLYRIIEDFMSELDFINAIYYLHQLIDIDPYDFEALIDITSCYLEIKEEEKAVKLCKEYLDHDIFNSAIWYQLGMIYETIDCYDKAIDAYEFSAAIDPDFAIALHNLGMIHQAMGQFETSNKWLLELLSKDPESTLTPLYIGNNYMEMEKPQKAMEYFEKAIMADSENEEAWFKIGEIYFNEHHWNESLLYTKKAIKIDPFEPNYWQRLGELLQILNHTQYAILAFKKVLSFKDPKKKTFLHLVECYFENKNYEETISTCINATEIYSDSFFYFLCGTSLIETNNLKKGINQLQLGLEIDKNAFDDFINFYPKIISFDAVKKLVNKINKK